MNRNTGKKVAVVAASIAALAIGGAGVVAASQESGPPGPPPAVVPAEAEGMTYESDDSLVGSMDADAPRGWYRTRELPGDVIELTHRDGDEVKEGRRPSRPDRPE